MLCNLFPFLRSALSKMKPRVMCDNPYAINSSSSDEEEEIRCKPHCQKQFVQEIVIPNPAEVKDRSPIAFGNHHSVRKMKFFKVDSDDDADEEVAIAYDAKKHDFDSIDQFQNSDTQSMALNLNSTVVEPEYTMKEDVHDFPVLDSENHVEFTEHRNLFSSKSGEWAARISHPITNEDIWLGTYFTREEAADAYDRKKLEFESLVVVGSVKTSASLSNLTMQRLIKGKADFVHSDDVSLDSYTNAYESAMLELQRFISTKEPTSNQSLTMEISTPLGSEYKSMIKENSSLMQRNGDIIASSNHRDTEVPRQLVLGQERVVRKRSRDETVDPSDSDCSEEWEDKEYQGVKLRKLGMRSAVVCDHTSKGSKPMENDESEPQALGAQETVDVATSSRRSAEIGIPWTKENFYLDTFDTQEEAADAFNKKKLEFQSMAEAEKENAQKLESVTDQSRSSSAFLPAPTFPKVEKSTVTFGNSYSSYGSCTVEDLSVMKMEQEDGFGCGIINCYGQLLGEYSKLDEEMWFCKDGEDEAAASAIESSISECYSWELKPPVNLGIV